MRIRRSLMLLMTFVTLALPAVSRAQTPATLTGESFYVEGVDAVVISSASCHPTGTSTFTYSAQGVAFGPYPGSFTEVGTITMGPLDLPRFTNGFQYGAITGVDAFFTIDSPAGQVTGTKRLTALSSEAFALCWDVTNALLTTGDIVTGTFRNACACALTLSYDATIRTATATYGDRGASGLIVSQFKATVNGTPYDQEVFNEAFVSALSEPFPVLTTGHVTGGGQIPGEITFGLEAKSDPNGMKARCTVVDRLADVMVKCLDMTMFVQAGNHVSFFGRATVNGTETRYTIDLDDVAEPGRGADTFKIVTTSGYAAAGMLTQGNVQVHRQ
jgi:hypothetical protein